MQNSGKYALIGVLLCALIFVSIPGQHLPAWLDLRAGSTSQTEPLAGALAAAGAKVQDFSINGWAQLPNSDLNEQELTHLVESAMAQLGIAKDGYTVAANRSQRHQLVRAKAIGDRFHAVAIAQVMQLSQGGSVKPEAYLVLNIEAVSDYGPIDRWRQKVDTIIRQSGGQPRIATCLTGWFDGKLEQDVREQLLARAYAALNGIIHDRVSYGHFTSFSGYSPQIADWLQVGGKRINVNMAMRYSPYDNRTYILVGSPVITREH